jgi:uncharacterized membrane protein YsdA (DUF1294 family)
VFGGVAGLVLAVLLVIAVDLPPYLAWVAGLSVVTFALYGLDKRRAIAGGWRVPERVLHGLTLAGGVPGGWVGRAIFRHKTRHLSFLIVLICATLLHAFIAWWLIG